QWPRVALVLVLLAGIGAGGWAVQHYARPPAGRGEARSQPREDQPDNNEENLEAAAPTLFDIQPDTIQVDSEPADSVGELAPEPVEPSPKKLWTRLQPRTKVFRTAPLAGLYHFHKAQHWCIPAAWD
ncbi:hypothetical protein D0N36_17440, partial [Hymenobacter lapidiphilus]|uniref:hypothetical protein n=1 Tax=Hymenobacter sp. CCM 8763 TaxID=2303334 RepID=UPI000E976E11